MTYHDFEHPDFISADFRTTDLRPANLKTDFHDVHTTVQSTSFNDSRIESFVPGNKAFVNSLIELVEPFESLGELRTSSKFTEWNSVKAKSKRKNSFPFLETPFRKSRSKRSLEMPLGTTDEGFSAKLKQIVVQEFEETIVSSEVGTLFSDCTESILGQNKSFRTQLSYGCDYWSERTMFTPITGYQGLAVGDVNNDGLDDVYICQEANLPNRLFVQIADGTATDRSAESGVDWLEGTRHALFVDLDNDGDQDLVVATFSWLVVMSNDGHGKFKTEETIRAARNGFSLSAADYDNDGFLDLYVCVYFPNTAVGDMIALPRLYHDANTGGRNYLIKNDGKWGFTDVTDEVGLGDNKSDGIASPRLGGFRQRSRSRFVRGQ